MAETALPAADPAQFPGQAAQFANDTPWGTLAATVLIGPPHPPRPRRRAGAHPSTDATAVRHRRGQRPRRWHPPATWGGYPGHPNTDIQSGRGAAGNTLMLPGPEETIISAPFQTRPTPAWFATQPGILPAFRALPAFEAAPTIPKLAALTRAALRHR